MNETIDRIQKFLINGNSPKPTREMYGQTWRVIDAEEINGESEPAGSELRAIAFKLKASKGVTVFDRAQFTTTDVLFAGPDGVFSHKISRDPNHEQNKASHIKDLEEKYQKVDQDGRVWVEWVLAVALMDVIARDGMRSRHVPKIMRLSVLASFVPPTNIADRYNPNLNPGMSLIEHMSELGDEDVFAYVANYEDLVNGEEAPAIEIDIKMAKKMVVDKELPDEFAQTLFESKSRDLRPAEAGVDSMVFAHVLAELDTIYGGSEVVPIQSSQPEDA